MKIAIVFDSQFQATPEEYEGIFADVTASDYEGEADPEYQVAQALRERGHTVWLIGAHDDPMTVIHQLREQPVDMVWNAAEGFGSAGDSLDFLLPAILEAEGQAYTGASPQCLMVTRNKAMTKKVLSHHNVDVPKFLVYRRGEKVRKNDDLSFPAIVKPLRLDASEGISKASIVQNKEALAERIQFVHERLRDAAIVEEFIDGRELYVGVIGNGDDLTILPTIELVFDAEKTRPEDRIATKMAKWDEPYREKFGIRQVFARPISKAARERIEETCRVAFRALWLRDYARFDLRLDGEDRVYVLEANANPYVSKGHEIANAAEKEGIGYPEFVERIVKTAAKRWKKTA